MSILEPAAAAVVLVATTLVGAAPFVAFPGLSAAMAWVRRGAGLVLVVGALIGILPEAVAALGLGNALALGAFGAAMFAGSVRLLHRLGGGNRAGTAGGILLVSALHKALDGVLVGVAFGLGTETGWAAVGAILLHELPHEGGTFALLVAAGASVRQAVIWKLLASLVAFPAVFAGWASGGGAEAAVPWLLPLVGGGFLYVGITAMLPTTRAPAPSPPEAGDRGCLQDRLGDV